MTKKYSIVLTALFCAFIGGIFLVSLLLPKKEFSQLENRYLQKPPELSLESLTDGQFMEDAEDYVSDHIAGRDFWVAAKAWSERLSGKRENNGVYFCEDGALITRFEEPDWTRVDSNIGYMNKFAEKAGVPVTFGLIPTQSTVWAGKLPADAPNFDQKKILDRAGAASAVPMADLYTALMAHRDEAVFYRTDHHWTSLGAYYAYAALGEALGYEPLPLETYTKATVSDGFYGTVFSSSGVRWVEPDTMDVYVPETDSITVESHTYDTKGNPVVEPRQLYDESYLDKKDKYAMFLGGQQALGVVKTGNTEKPKLLLIRDSYSDSLVPFLTPHFSEIHLIDLRYYKLSASQYIADNGIDQALVLYSVPNFVSDTNLVWLGR